MAKEEGGGQYETGADLVKASPPKKVWIRARGGAGGYSHRYGLDFNAGATILCEGEAAERALLAIEECPHEYEPGEPPALMPTTKS